MVELVQEFRQTGSVANKKRDRECELPLRNETVEVALLGQVRADPPLSMWKLANVTNIGRTRIGPIL